MGPDDHGFFASHATVQLVYRCTILDLASGQPVVTPFAGAQPGWKNDIAACLDWHINSQFHVIVNWRYIQTLGVTNRSYPGAIFPAVGIKRNSLRRSPILPSGNSECREPVGDEKSRTCFRPSFAEGSPPIRRDGRLRASSAS